MDGAALTLLLLLTSDPAERYTALIDAAVEGTRELTDDPSFLRRVSLDLEGLIPSERDAARFEADAGADRRRRLIEEVYGRRTAAKHRGRTWAWMLLGPVELPKERKIDREAFAAWLAQGVREDAPWDRIVRDMLTASGTRDTAPPASFLLSTDGQASLTGKITDTFLGTSLECAECHDHKEEAFTRQDFWGVAAFFGRTRQRGKKAEAAVVDMERGETHLGEDPEAIAPKVLGGSPRPLTDGLAMRTELAEWLTSGRNPWFARAFVNQIWVELLGVPLTEPKNGLGTWRCEDKELAPQQRLHCALATELSRQGFAIRPLLIGIVRSRAYQAKASAATGPIPTYRARLLPPLVLGPSILRATGELEGRHARRDAIQIVKGLTKAYGEGGNDPSRAGGASLPLELLLMNGPLATRSADRGRGTLEDEARARYYPWLGRGPTAEELAAVRAIAAEHGEAEAIADLEWALLNSSELATTH